MKFKMNQVVMAHTFNASTGEAEAEAKAGGSL